MQTYELLYMIPPSFSETEIGEVVQRVNGYIGKTGGQTTKEDRWGVRKLAYPIGQFHQAHYVLLDVLLDEKRVAELDQLLRREEQVLRHLVTSVRPKIPEQLEGERRLTEERSRPRSSEDEARPRDQRGSVAGSIAPAAAPTPASASVVKEPKPVVQPEPQPQSQPRTKPVSDDVAAMEDEAKQAKEKPTEPGFLQEQGKSKDINLEDLDKKIDEILKDDML